MDLFANARVGHRASSPDEWEAPRLAPTMDGLRAKRHSSPEAGSDGGFATGTNALKFRIVGIGGNGVGCAEKERGTRGMTRGECS